MLRLSESTFGYCLAGSENNKVINVADASDACPVIKFQVEVVQKEVAQQRGKGVPLGDTDILNGKRLRMFPQLRHVFQFDRDCLRE